MGNVKSSVDYHAQERGTERREYVQYGEWNVRGGRRRLNIVGELGRRTIACSGSSRRSSQCQLVVIVNVQGKIRRKTTSDATALEMRMHAKGKAFVHGDYGPLDIVSVGVGLWVGVGERLIETEHGSDTSSYLDVILWGCMFRIVSFIWWVGVRTWVGTLGE
ncbi:hypothetical protein BDQ17DRAFT_552212 [Cyathus striatus]|nr:hypothetical protein BDQ17DRAFT_552212 [Cyathus striatus]